MRAQGRPGAPGLQGGCLPALKCHLPLSVGGASRLDLRVGAVECVRPRARRWAPARQPLVDFLTWAEGAEGPVYRSTLGLGKVSETRETEVKAARSASFQDKSQRFCRHRLSPGAGVRPRLSPCPPSLSPSPSPRPPAHADPGTHPTAATQTGRCSR